MITFYNLPASPISQKVRILLEEAAIPYREVHPRRDADGNHAPAFLRVSPAGTVPAIEDPQTGASVFESAAILIYLAEKAGRFLPQKQPDRAEVLTWLVFEAANIGPACIGIYALCCSGDPGAEAGLRLEREKLHKAMGVIEARLVDRPYLAGECSIADFALYPWTSMLEDFAEVPLTRFPNLARWAGTMQERPGVRQAQAGRPA